MRRDNFDDGEESLDESVENMNLDHAPNWGNGVGADRRDGLRASISDSKEEGKGKEGEKEKQDREIVGGFIKGKENEECKLVLVVRTDLGMGKGPSSPLVFPQLHVSNMNSRQNRSTM